MVPSPTKVGFFYFMITVYVLLSDKDGATYVGMAKDVSNRLREHNAGKNRYTKGHIPWRLIYEEVHADWSSSRLREKYLKSTTGKNWLQKYFAENGGITGFPA
jgi:putative endonuclease